MEIGEDSLGISEEISSAEASMIIGELVAKAQKSTHPSASFTFSLEVL